MTKKKKDHVPLADTITRTTIATSVEKNTGFCFDIVMDVDINIIASSVPPPVTNVDNDATTTTTTKKKKNLVPLLDRKGETYDPPPPALECLF